MCWCHLFFHLQNDLCEAGTAISYHSNSIIVFHLINLLWIHWRCVCSTKCTSTAAHLNLVLLSSVYHTGDCCYLSKICILSSISYEINCLSHLGTVIFYTHVYSIKECKKFTNSWHSHLINNSSKLTGTPAALNTSLTPPISSGPTPSPGMRVTVWRPAGRDIGSAIYQWIPSSLINMTRMAFFFNYKNYKDIR